MPKVLRLLSVLGLCFLLLIAALPASAGSGTPRWQCWGPGLPDPCRNTLYDVDVDPYQGRAWAVGAKGTILYWNGESWAKEAVPTAEALFSVDAIRPKRAVAAGAEGVMLHREGGAWATQDLRTHAWVRVVEMVPGSSGEQGWAAADKYGLVQMLSWEGSHWEKGSGHNVGGTMYHLALLNADYGWGVGSVLGDKPGSGFGTIGKFYRWDGTSWAYDLSVAEPLRAVALRTTHDGWAVGEAGGIYRWDGDVWTAWASPTEETLYDVAIVGPDDAWAVGEMGVICHWDGSSWAVQPSPVSLDLRGVAMFSAMEGWAVGQGGTILRWDGQRWLMMYGPEVGRLDGICMTPGTEGRDGWAVGNDRTMLHWNGLSWRPVEGPHNSYYRVAMLAPDDGWASGSRRICHWDGAAWTCTALANSPRALAPLSPTDAWAVGWGVIQHWDGASWQEVPSPASTTFEDMAAVSATDIWAVGGRTIIHYDGGAWRTVDSEVDWSMLGVGMARARAGWAVGFYGNLARWDGTAWRTYADKPGHDTLWDVDVIATPGRVVGWAVGSDGTLVRLEGNTASLVDSPTSNTLRAVEIVDGELAWAVGDGGVILYTGALPDADAVHLPLVIR
jgi:hypothetical protein